MQEMKAMLTALLEGQQYLTARMDSMEHHLNQLTGEVKEVKKEVKELNMRVSHLEDTVSKIETRVSHIEDKVIKIEEKMVTKDELHALSQTVTDGFQQTAATLESAYQSIDLLNNEQTIRNIKGIR
ncbi:hypothetical protein [Thermoflavimicrobium daqui]|jgi:predicted nuclease with TOPRIM domain|uniref:Uncharacterized protein n=1 Tax=Thermoflavimicrobium daqui TaxID=2137476 RepID=A0A364K8H8_9BACL|nr:hypothetical protein [Thermoflavimicrobium daqui]RAL26594.1 hypothetical protein DL897_00645 [Thermoflavimicrobium daqui]